MISKLISRCQLLNRQYANLQGFYISARQSSITTWNKDWKPGPYPKTEEERRIAARKYNLIPEDYKPFPEEEGYGDYPDLPPVSAAARNPYTPFDYTHLKRNYGEPLHKDFDLYLEERINTEEKFIFSIWGQLLFLTCFASSIFGLIYLGDQLPYRKPAVPKQFPYQGRKHYTFEPETS